MDLGAAPSAYNFQDDPYSVASLILSTVVDVHIPLRHEGSFLGCPIDDGKTVLAKGENFFQILAGKGFKFIHENYELIFTDVFLFNQSQEGQDPLRDCAALAKVSLIYDLPGPRFMDSAAAPASTAAQKSVTDSTIFTCVAFSSIPETLVDMKALMKAINEKLKTNSGEVIATGFEDAGQTVLKFKMNCTTQTCRVILFDTINFFEGEKEMKRALQQSILHYMHHEVPTMPNFQGGPQVIVHTKESPESLTQQVSRLFWESKPTDLIQDRGAFLTSPTERRM